MITPQLRKAFRNKDREAAHVFDRPGTFVVRLTDENGEEVKGCILAQPNDPNPQDE